MLVFLLITVVLAILAHSFVRRWSVATAVAAMTATGVNLLHESWGRWSNLRPDDLFFWGPLLLIVSMILAVVISALIGLPFFGARVGREMRPPDGEAWRPRRWSDWGRSIGRFI